MRYTYSLVDELMASPADPLPSEKRTHQLARMWQGLASIERDAEPTKADWKLCSDAVNMVEALVELGVCDDSSGLLDDAAVALGAAGQRSLDGKPIRLDGPGIQAVRAVLQDYAELIAVLPARVMIRAHRRAERRTIEILMGKSKQNDVRIRNG